MFVLRLSDEHHQLYACTHAKHFYTFCEDQPCDQIVEVPPQCPAEVASRATDRRVQ